MKPASEYIKGISALNESLDRGNPLKSHEIVFILDLLRDAKEVIDLGAVIDIEFEDET